MADPEFTDMTIPGSSGNLFGSADYGELAEQGAARVPVMPGATTPAALPTVADITAPVEAAGAEAGAGLSAAVTTAGSDIAALAPTVESATGALSDVGAALATGAGEAALAIPGVGEVLGAGAAAFGLYEGIKDLFSSQPSAPAVVENQVQAMPSFVSQYSGGTNLQQSFQSGV